MHEPGWNDFAVMIRFSSISMLEFDREGLYVGMQITGAVLRLPVAKGKP